MKILNMFFIGELNLYFPITEEEQPESATIGSETGLTGLSQLPTPSIVTPTPTEGAAAEKHTLTPPDGPPYKRRRYLWQSFFLGLYHKILYYYR